MRKLVTAVFLSAALALSAQTEKSSAAASIIPTASTVRAVIVGISDYQDPAIPDLRFAHRDAEAFADWLRSTRGPGRDSVPDDNIRLMLNDKATLGQFVASLDWLREVSREGDQVIIYFSGHGDVDSKLLGQPGFLLLWDTPSQTYMAGAYGLWYFQLVISTLSVQNKAGVTVITDVCHAGKLADNPFGGPQIANSTLLKQFANEIKILSCQPDEFSVEGEQWGGGRGAFSYHLVDGLYGLADQNEDDRITLLEIGRYLEDRVTDEVAPVEQTPVTVGDKKERVAAVNPVALAQWLKNKTGRPVEYKAVDQRGLEEKLLAGTDSSIQRLYAAFRQALKDKVFLDPPDSCANAYYERLMTIDTLRPLRGAMTRNFAAALMDDSQQALNRWMRADVREFSIPRMAEMLLRYAPFPRQLEKAAELLGSGCMERSGAAIRAKKPFCRCRAGLPEICPFRFKCLKPPMSNCKKTKTWRA